MIKIILLAYLLLINIITYFTYATDKTKARHLKFKLGIPIILIIQIVITYFLYPHI